MNADFLALWHHTASLDYHHAIKVDDCEGIVKHGRSLLACRHEMSQRAENLDLEMGRLHYEIVEMTQAIEASSSFMQGILDDLRNDLGDLGVDGL